MRRPLQVPKLDLVGGVCAPDLHRELHLQELVSLLPFNLRAQQKGITTGADGQMLLLSFPGAQQPAHTHGTPGATKPHWTLNTDELVGSSHGDPPTLTVPSP